MTRLIDADTLKYEPLPKGERNYCTYNLDDAYEDGYDDAFENIRNAPTVDINPTLREKALLLLVKWAEECGFGYDNFPEEYEKYKDKIEGMGYIDGMIYIAERVVEDTSGMD